MSYKVGATQAEEDISKNAQKIVDSYQNMKSEETVMEYKEKKVDPFLTMNFDEKVYSPHLRVMFFPPEESTDSVAVVQCKILPWYTYSRTDVAAERHPYW
ncbi:hypothetical protein V6N13_119022 [Hibiscus sabdariffa]|uniref:Uncharacterized protein n=1 Tax=Hibiscus sabdariffa TaxID=183260 RepID=A0ABR2E3I6_9ROSI